MTLRSLRNIKGLTQLQTAEKINVPQSSISQWESGECFPKPQKIQALARLYGVTSDDIITAIAEVKQNSA